MIADRRGILSLPVKTAVAVLVIAAMTPVVLGAMDYADDVTESAGIESEAEAIAEAITKAYYGGEGTVISVKVSLYPGESIEMGGTGADMYTLRLISSGEQVGKVYLERPSVPILGECSVSGDVILRLTCAVQDGVYGVTVGP